MSRVVGSWKFLTSVNARKMRVVERETRARKELNFNKEIERIDSPYVEMRKQLEAMRTRSFKVADILCRREDSCALRGDRSRLTTLEGLEDPGQSGDFEKMSSPVSKRFVPLADISPLTDRTQRITDYR